MFTDTSERTRAMGFFGFVMAAGGSIGVLLGGVLTDAVDWHWIFLVNLPIGFAVLALSLRLLTNPPRGEARLDLAGAVTVTSAIVLGLSAKIVMRFGIRAPLAIGMSLIAVGLLLFARAPVDGSFLADVLPAMLIMGFGVGLAFNPVLLAAMSDVDPAESGLASGVANTSFMMGGALGLAVLASLAALRTDSLLASGEEALAALNGGYHLAFLVGAGFAAIAAVLAATHLRSPAAAGERPGQGASPGEAITAEA